MLVGVSEQRVKGSLAGAGPLRRRGGGCDGAGHHGDIVVGAAEGCCLRGRLAEAAQRIVGVAFVVLFLDLAVFLLVMGERADGGEGVEEKGHREDLREDGRHDQ